MKRVRSLLLIAFGAAVAQCQSFDCDLREYRPAPGLSAAMASGGLQFTWQGERGRR